MKIQLLLKQKNICTHFVFFMMTLEDKKHIILLSNGQRVSHSLSLIYFSIMLCV